MIFFGIYCQKMSQTSNSNTTFEPFADPSKPVRHIVSMSGGKDSTALALHISQTRPELDVEYVFCDTGSEMDETYQYLNQIEAFLGKKILRLPQDMEGGTKYHGFEHWLKVFGGLLPSPQMRWCTAQLKLKPFEEFVGDDNVYSYIGIRADEDRSGHLTAKPNIRTVFPFKEDGIDYKGVMKILEDSGIGMPPYLEWGRTHSGCYFCFYQKPIEWVRLLEKHPEKFDQAQAFEKVSDEPGKSFSWIQGMPLAELRKPENVSGIKERYAKRQEMMKKKRGNKKLVETLCGLEGDDDEEVSCLICQK